MANRNVHSPSVIFGIRPGFNIADLPSAYAGSFQAMMDITTSTTSAPVDIGARSIEVHPTFEHVNTSCDIAIIDGNSTQVAFFPGVTFATADSLNVGGYENVDLQAKPFTIQISNIVNPSNINVFIKKTS